MKISVITPHVLLMLLFLFSVHGWAADSSFITGRWITYDDNSGEKRSIVTISEQAGQLFARISEVFFQPGDETTCVNCTGEKQNQEIVGLEIFHGLTFDGRVWQGGTILDPENGREYDCELRLDGKTLNVRGYVFFFFRTQQWKKMESSEQEE